MAIVGLKFYKTYSSSMREMIYKSVGQNHSYMEHGSLKKFMTGGLKALVPGGRVPLSKSPCGSFRPIHKRVAFVAFLREPVSRWLSMLHMASWKTLNKVNCSAYTLELVEKHIKGPSDLMLGANPYGKVFGAESTEAVPRVLDMLARDFVVGTSLDVHSFLFTLSRLIGTQSDFFSKNMVHEHNAGSYCTLATLPNLTQSFLRGRMALDHTIFLGASEIGRAQAKSQLRLPTHFIRELMTKDEGRNTSNTTVKLRWTPGFLLQ